MTLIDQPRELRSFTELDAVIEQHLAKFASGVPKKDAEKICQDCGRERRKYATRCPQCAKKRRREAARQRQRHRRANSNVQVSRFSEIRPFPDKGLQSHFPGGRLRGHPGHFGAQKRDRNAPAKEVPEPRSDGDGGVDSHRE